MKKLLKTFVFTTLLLVGCNHTNHNTIKVGVQFYPMKDILELINDDVEENGYTLEIIEFSDYQTPNNALLHKELDANMIQHQYFLNAFNSANNTTELEIIAPVYHATFALYSRDYTSVDDIPNGSTITLPDDSTNLSRALYLLSQGGLITLREGKTVGLTLSDIISNPKNLNLEDQVPLTSLAPRYVETRLAVMYPTYARSLELVGNAERLYVEEQDEVTEGYAISVATHQDFKMNDKITLLIDLIHTDKVRNFLIENYSWASSPAF